MEFATAELAAQGIMKRIYDAERNAQLAADLSNMTDTALSVVKARRYEIGSRSREHHSRARALVPARSHWVLTVPLLASHSRRRGRKRSL